MATSIVSSDMQTPLLYDDTVQDSVDYKGRPVFRSTSGGWRSAFFIYGVEVAERCAYWGIASNLITYLTGSLGQSTAVAAQNVNAWSGTTSLLPLLGAFVADSFLGRYRTIFVALLIYVLGLGLLTLSAMLPSLSGSDCQATNLITACSPISLQAVLFFCSLYLVAVGQGVQKPCAQAFGADQFDGRDPEECKAKASFFNWWNFCACVGTSTAQLILSYIQDNLNWGLGFGIPCIMMAVALVIFLLGTNTYRFITKGEEKGAFLRIGCVLIATIRNWRTKPPAVASKEEAHGILPHQSSEKLKFLNKALIAPNGSVEDDKLCSLNDVKEAKAVLRLVPIWATCLIFAIVYAQSSTFYTKQGVTLDRSIFPGFNIPAASLQSLISLSILVFVPIYDCIFVPLARNFTRKPSGITMLQRIGTGIFLSVSCMVIAALVEMKRLKTAQEFGLVDMPNVTIPLSIWWLIPQYALFGIAEVFTTVGLQEFFYDQVSRDLRSVGLSLYLSIFGVGSFLSSFLVSTIEKATGGNGRDSWFANNLNRAHLDYFYWLLAGLSAVQFVAFLYFAKYYVYARQSTM